nr:hypothetical protein [Arthrospira sp. PLM2.Bin9]
MYLGSLRLLRVREFAFLQAIACTSYQFSFYFLLIVARFATTTEPPAGKRGIEPRKERSHWFREWRNLARHI